MARDFVAEELELKREDLKLRRKELSLQKWPLLATLTVALVAAAASIGVAAWNARAERERLSEQWTQVSKDAHRKELQDAVISYTSTFAKAVDRAHSVTYLYAIQGGSLTKDEYVRYDEEQRRNIFEFDISRGRLLMESPSADKAFLPLAAELFYVDEAIATKFVATTKELQAEPWANIHQRIRNIDISKALRSICPLLVRPGLKQVDGTADVCPTN